MKNSLKSGKTERGLTVSITQIDASPVFYKVIYEFWHIADDRLHEQGIAIAIDRIDVNAALDQGNCSRVVAADDRLLHIFKHTCAD